MARGGIPTGIASPSSIKPGRAPSAECRVSAYRYRTTNFCPGRITVPRILLSC